MTMGDLMKLSDLLLERSDTRKTGRKTVFGGYD
jgi:hypothetical protein